MTSQLNVNLNWNPRDPETEGRVLIPCPIPRSVTFSVLLGECVRPCGQVLARAGAYGITEPSGIHSDGCPARPVRVSCSISGKTWEDSRVSLADNVAGGDVPHFTFDDPVLVACRDRWALVKALVLGTAVGDYAGWCGPSLTPVRALFAQRNTVFSALADMARAEDACVKAWLTIPVELRKGPGPVRLAPEALERYVEMLIEQAGTL